MQLFLNFRRFCKLDLILSHKTSLLANLLTKYFISLARIRALLQLDDLNLLNGHRDDAKISM